MSICQGVNSGQEINAKYKTLRLFEVVSACVFILNRILLYSICMYLFIYIYIYIHLYFIYILYCITFVSGNSYMLPHVYQFQVLPLAETVVFFWGETSGLVAVTHEPYKPRHSTTADVVSTWGMENDQGLWYDHPGHGDGYRWVCLG